MQYRTIFISDVHLGTKNCKAGELIDFLKNNSSDTLYLVGDIIDGWKIQQNKLKWKKTHTDVIREILKKSTKGTRVVYVSGNHDEFLRPMINLHPNFGLIEVCNQAEHEGVNGEKFLVIHGDLFDGITRLAPWLSFLGDKAYDLVLSMNSKFNWLRHKFGFGYWSLSKYLKHKVKKSVDFIFRFEKNLVAYCKKRNFDGVICGHIHHAEIKMIDDILYMNDGDWVESMTALVEHYNGKWEIIQWTKIDDQENIDSNRQPENSN